MWWKNEKICRNIVYNIIVVSLFGDYLQFPHSTKSVLLNKVWCHCLQEDLTLMICHRNTIIIIHYYVNLLKERCSVSQSVIEGSNLCRFSSVCGVTLRRERFSCSVNFTSLVNPLIGSWQNLKSTLAARGEIVSNIFGG